MQPERVLWLMVTLVSLVRHSAGYSGGAPIDACSDVTPQHGAAAQTPASSPYSITFSPATFTAGGTPITVTLATSSPVFKGFLLTTQYVDACVDQTIKPGTFDLPAGTQYTCSNGAVTHQNSGDKTTLTFQWTPPATSQGHIHFRATFVQSYNTFWVDVRPTNMLLDSALSPTFTQGTCTPTTAAATTPAPTGTVAKDAECGKTKGCYSDCSGSSCNFLMTWAPGSSTDRALITLAAPVGSPSGRYIAFGLSDDSKMGSDSVTYCINEAGGAFNSYNEGRVNVKLTDAKAGLTSIVTNYVNGVLSCSFERTIAVDATQKRFDLNKAYTLFYATGPGSASGAGRHDQNPLVSTQAASLLDYTVDISGAADFPLVKAHGSLMMVAWIFAASIGIVIARYFKNVWEDSTWFGQKIWFQIHRACMILAFCATAAAFVIIFVEVGGYSDIQGEGYEKAHPIIGIIVMILTVLNPIMALFRPHPGTKNRPIFNWLHWGVGISAYTLGVVAIFFGVEFEKAGAPDYMLYILLAFVAWQFLVQVVLEVLQCVGRGSTREGKPSTIMPAEGEVIGEGHSDKYEMTDLSGRNASDSTSSRKSTFNKQVLIFLHILVVTGFTIALIIVLNVREDEDDD